MLTILIAIFIISVAAQHPYLHDLMMWDAHLITNGEVWRIITGHFTHANFNHFLLNIAGIGLILLLFPSSCRAKPLSLAMLGISILTGISLLFTDVLVYTGLSGILHGFFMFLVLSEIAFHKKKLDMAILLGLIIKLIYEQVYGSSEMIETLINMPVASNAHLIGAISGGVVSAVFLYYRQVLSIKKGKTEAIAS